MVADEVLGELVAGVLVGADDLPHDADGFEGVHVPIHRAEGQFRSLFDEFGHGGGTGQPSEQLDEISSTLGVDEFSVANASLREAVDFARVDGHADILLPAHSLLNRNNSYLER